MEIQYSFLLHVVILYLAAASSNCWRGCCASFVHWRSVPGSLSLPPARPTAQARAEEDLYGGKGGGGGGGGGEDEAKWDHRAAVKVCPVNGCQKSRCAAPCHAPIARGHPLEPAALQPKPHHHRGGPSKAITQAKGEADREAAL